jgi:hypothetical protein
MINNKELLDSFATITLGEAIEPIKDKIIAIDVVTEATTYGRSYFEISEKELTLYADADHWNPDEQWRLDTKVKISETDLEIEGTKLKFLIRYQFN